MKGKSTTIAIVLLLLVGFPLASYLYLRKGMNFRLGAIEALQVKSNLPQVYHDTLGHRVSLMYISNDGNQARIEGIQTHFSDREDISYQASRLFDSPLRDSLNAAIGATATTGADLRDLIFLINEKQQIVNCYSSADEAAVSTLIEHIAFLIPPDPEKDFDFIRSREK